MRCRSSSDRVVEILLLFFSYYIKKAVSQIGNVVITIKPYVMNYYNKQEIVGDKLVITQVREEVLHSIQINEANGNAIITHIGAYKQIKFIFNGESFISDLLTIAIAEDKSKCIFIKDISFDKDIDSNWNRYIYSAGNEYWIEAV
jgi:hypothetical protein